MRPANLTERGLAAVDVDQESCRVLLRRYAMLRHLGLNIGFDSDVLKNFRLP
jgi:hypothetical protein